MSKRLKIYIAFFILVIGLMMYIEYTKPKPINWTPSYSTKDKIPLGTYILFKEISKLFSNKEIKLVDTTPAFYLNKHRTETGSTYLIINQNTPLSESDTDVLLNFVNNGNNVFLVSSTIPDKILDSLKLKVQTSHYVLTKNFYNVSLYLHNPVFSNTQYKFEKINNYNYFSQINLPETVILGEYLTSDSEKKINFIKQKYGEGYFYLHLFPEAYSNYFMKKDENFSYAINALNYIDTDRILWDENKKSIKTPKDNIMMYIFGNPPLLWAWRILLVSGIFYCLFFGKRLQRIIPIIKPLKNTTVEFTKTIGNLYYNNKEHQDISNKKIKFFLYYIKENYFIDIEKIDEQFSEKLHLKSGVSKEITNKIVSLILKNQNSQSSSEDDLRTVNTIIDLFYKKVK